MIVSLRPFATKDLEAYENWRNEINASRYMSNFFPRNFNGGEVDNHGLYVWHVIIADGVDVGTIWLEKEKPHEPVVTLGVLIGKREKLGVGIGRLAISQAIRQAAHTLHFTTVKAYVRNKNERAIACYKHCGFKIFDQGHKINPDGEKISFYEMRLTSDNFKA